MRAKVDKVILTNTRALNGKYGSKGTTQVLAAVQDLIRADKRRGLETVLVSLDDKVAMKRLSAPPVANPLDPKANKMAVDGVYRALTPDYILLLGSIDVIPHQDMKNPMYAGPSGDDSDALAYGDLPYACDAPYSQAPQDFVGPVRVVGRLPDVTGADDPSYLIGVLATATGYKAVDRSSLKDYFAVTAQVWEASSRLSTTNTFGDASALQNVPPSDSSWPPPLLARPMHFFNCHGAPESAQFYGQPADASPQYPVALDASYVNGKIHEGTLAATEACYGGELYALSSVQKQLGICNTYLANRSYGFFASTTIAYGPDEGNGQADLICQYFLQDVLGGASLGRAALQARQKFVRTASPPNPADIKTLAQFNLYGDPSITPVIAPETVLSRSATARTRIAAERSERHDRRRLLLRQGISLYREPRVERARTAPSRAVLQALRTQARALGLAPGAFLSFSLRYAERGRATPGRLTDRSTMPRGYHVLFLKREPPETRQSPVHPIVVLIGKEVDGKIISIRMLVSR